MQQPPSIQRKVKDPLPKVHKTTKTMVDADYSIPVSLGLAGKYGVCSAMLIQLIHYRCRNGGVEYNDSLWVTRTMREWEVELNGLFSVSTIRAALRKLRIDGIVIAGNFNQSPTDQRLWWRLDPFRTKLVVKEVGEELADG